MLWPFANPWMLLWSLAVAVPIAIHFISRRRFAEQHWAAMEFLLEAIRKSAARLRLEHLLLLAVRALVLLLLAAALAEPILAPPGGAAARTPGERTHAILVLDSSYSMRYAHNGKTRFAAAQQLAAERIASLSRGEAVTIVDMGDPPHLVTPQPLLQPLAARRELAALSPSQQGADLPATLTLLERAIDDARRDSPSLARTEVVFYSDMGETSWNAATTSTNSDAPRRLIQSLAAKASLTHVDVGQPNAANAAVVRLEALPSLSTVGEPIEFEVEVRAFGAAQQRELELIVDGAPIARRTIEVAAGDSAVERFAHRFAAPGPHVVVARLNDDLLSVDDRRWLAIDVRDSLRVLCVAGKPGAARFVSTALAALSARGVQVEVDNSSDSALAQRNLAQYDAIVLCNVARFARQEALALEQFTQAGGGLVIFLGDQVQSDSYNAELTADELHGSLLPARIESLSAAADYRFDALDYRHPIVAPFRGHPRSGLLTTTVRRYFQLAPHDDASVALAISSGDPAIVAAPYGRGTCILVATAASDQSIDTSVDPPRAYNDLYREPLFPPLIERMIALAADNRRSVSSARVAEPIFGAADGLVTITLPADAQETPMPRSIVVHPDPKTREWSFGQTELSGIYKATPEDAPEDLALFAVNIDPRESDLARTDLAALPDELRPADETAAASSPALAAGPARPLHAALLAAVLLLLATESCLAWRFGSSAA